ncbi:MAG TPA: hypothetical protein DIS82_14190 [Exiguobacterium sp.]|nr:hypothetical protein [Exiguobacterium sp.]
MFNGAQEVVRSVFAHGFNEWGLNRIESLVQPDNTASQRLLERIGF